MQTAIWLKQTALCLCSSFALICSPQSEIIVRTVSTPAGNPSPSSTPAADSANMVLSYSGDSGIFGSAGSGLTGDLTDGGIHHLYRRDLLTHQTRLPTVSALGPGRPR